MIYRLQRMDKNHLDNLIYKYINDIATSAEREELLHWYREKNETDVAWPSEFIKEEEAVRLRMLNNIRSHIASHVPKKYSRKNLWYGSVAAAMLIVIVSAGIYHRYFSLAQEKNITAYAIPSDILPGGNKARLTLANGLKVVLDSVRTGLLINEGNATILKKMDGQIEYRSKVNRWHELTVRDTSAVVYNTISTPRGGKYQVILSDGTQVWLNAASSLRFPVTFSGKERAVELTGEAYFEVAKNKFLSFKVISTGQTVQVLGTHFNISSYPDEASVKTTLLEGKVEVIKNKTFEKRILKPGYEANIGTQSTGIGMSKVEATKAVAWKEGMFSFKNADIKSILRQAARWYDVEVRYKGKTPNEKFTGEIPSNLPASMFLEMLSFAGIKFEIAGRIITVTTI